MEEFDDQYTGEGIKRIKAYKSNLLYDQIDKLREEYYGNDNINQIIHLYIQLNQPPKKKR